MHKLSPRLVSAAVALLVAVPWTAAAATPPAGDPARGQVVYERYCISCHGTNGDGRGEAGDWVFPRPRDFRQGTFKWRSTPSGSLPTISDLERTIDQGVYGTYMPTWKAIGHRNRLRLRRKPVYFGKLGFEEGKLGHGYSAACLCNTGPLLSGDVLEKASF